MAPFLHIDWHTMLVPQIALFEIFLRGTAIYFLLLALLRIFKRPAGAVGISDLLVIVLLADASQNAMSSDYKSLPEGAVLIATIMAWDQFFDWLGFHVPAVERLLRARPVVLVRRGKVNRRNMRHELLTTEELMSQLRQQGISDLSEVVQACMEGDGQIGIVRKTGEASKPDKKRAERPRTLCDGTSTHIAR